MAAQKATIEDAQTEISTTIGHLGKAKENAPDEVDQLAIDAQIRDLASKWLELDALRASTDASAEIKKAVDTLAGIDDDIQKASEDVKQVAKVIHLAAQAVGVIEKLLPLLGV